MRPAGDQGEETPAIHSASGGAKGQNRTGDTAVFSRVLYLLSYLGVGEAGLEPATPSV